MKGKRRKFSPQFKANFAIEAIRESHTLAELAEKNFVPNQKESSWIYLNKTYRTHLGLKFPFFGGVRGGFPTRQIHAQQNQRRSYNFHQSQGIFTCY